MIGQQFYYPPILSKQNYMNASIYQLNNFMKARRVIVQLGLVRCLYPNQNDFSNLRAFVSEDLWRSHGQFEFMYVDQQNGQWMIIQSQQDLNKILYLNTDYPYILLKVLPKNEDQTFLQKKSKENTLLQTNKINLSKQQKQMFDELAKQYMRRIRYNERQDKLKNQCTNLVRKTFPRCQRQSAISSIVQSNLQIQNRRSQRKIHFSPIKIAEQRIEMAIEKKITSIMPKFISLSMRKIKADLQVDRNGRDGMAGLEQIICEQLCNKMSENPQNY